MSEFLFWYFGIGLFVFVALFLMTKDKACNLFLTPLFWPITGALIIRWWWLSRKVQKLMYCGWCGLGQDGGMMHEEIIEHIMSGKCENHPLKGRIDRAEDRVYRLEVEADKYETALHVIADWAKAYPLEVFPEPDMKKVRELLAAGGIPIDFVSASNMRHVVTRVAEIAAQALAEGLRVRE
jgi:hypothetical protein